MKNLSISRKIGLILAISILFNVIIGISGYISMSHISNNTNNISNNAELLKNQTMKLNQYSLNLKYQVSKAKSIAIETLLKKQNVLKNQNYITAKNTTNQIIKDIAKFSKKYNKKDIAIKANELRKKSIGFFMILESLQEEFDDSIENGIEVLNEDVTPIELALNKVVNDFSGNSNKKFKLKMDQVTNNLHQAKDEISNSEINNTIFNIIAIILSLSIGIYIMQEIVSSILTFQNGVIGFFKYLNRETNDVKMLDDSSSDEIGSMAKVVNDNISKIETTIEQDNALIAEAQILMGRVEHGWYSQTIEKSTSNESLNNFKDSVNKMILATKENFNMMNARLEEYANYNYTNELSMPNIEKNGVFDLLINDINKLREAITSMLVENKSNGLTLQNSSDTLLSNISNLSSASNQAAASLEETAAAIEEITSNIINNTSNVVKMASHGNEVKDSVSSGQNLASKTTTAMDEINVEVTAISDAISVIDQIAFQTNILSLNAAVEAATAGEAGKGFAVVAQEVRNLATRSAEAANEIKKLVENAKNKANDGKSIADEMIDGYTHLNESISKTLDLVSDVEMASKEQQTAIEQINDAVTKLDQQTQQNASVANTTKDIAIQTQSIAQDIVEDADEKEFIGKGSVKAKNIDNTKSQTTISTPAPTKKPKAIVSSNDTDEWESF